MKISCLPVSFFNDIIEEKMSLKQWAHIGKEVGLDAIDISIMFVKSHVPVYIKQIQEDIIAENMEIIMITTYPDFSHPEKKQRERELEYLKYDIALASQLGARYLRITAGQAHPETSEEDGIKWVVENFKKACETADQYNIKLVYENHAKPGAWQYIDFSHPTHIFLKIVEGIEDTNIGINFDTANTIAYGDDAIPVLKKVMHKIMTIHAADTSTRGVLNHTLLGTGLVPFREIFSLLKQNHYDGWICIEEGSNKGVEGVKAATQYVKEVWESV